jgi:hypothetical protein
MSFYTDPIAPGAGVLLTPQQIADAAIARLGTQTAPPAAMIPYPPTLEERLADFWTGVKLGKPMNLAVCAGIGVGGFFLVKALTKKPRSATLAGYGRRKRRRRGQQRRR